MTETMHDRFAVAALLGCSTRRACAVIRELSGADEGSDSASLRVSAPTLTHWLATMAAAGPMPTVRSGDSVCYFIQDSGGFVKIGETDHIGRRITEVQKMHAMPVTLLAAFSGGAMAEAYFQGRFCEHHIHSEWYRLTGSLLQFVNELGPSPTRIVARCGEQRAA